MSWIFRVDKHAIRDLRSVPRRDLERIDRVLDEMAENPYSGDIRWLRGDTSGLLRRRVGDWRTLFELDPEAQIVRIRRVVRRTGGTYKRA